MISTADLWDERGDELQSCSVQLRHSGGRTAFTGVVIHGVVRDVAALRELPLGVLALGSNPRKSAKVGVGDRDTPVSFGGVDFVPGQVLWADEDGVVATRP